MTFKEWLIKEGGKGSGAKPNFIKPRGMFKPAKPQVNNLKITTFH